MIVKITVTNLDPGNTPQVIAQQLADAIRAQRGRPVKVNLVTRDTLTGVDITSILPRNR